MKLTHARYTRDLLRYRLAVRLLRFDTRTRVIQRWTGLSMRRVRALRLYAMSEDTDVPRRGVAPYQPAVFFSSAKTKTEAAILAGLLYVFEAIPRTPLKDPEQDFPALVRGMRICDAYEYFHTRLPETRLSLEHAMLLGLELTKGDELKIGRCTHCGALILVDQLAIAEALCITCAGDHTQDRSNSEECAGDAQELPSSEAKAKEDALQGSLF